MDNFVYFLIHPGTTIPFYIGKGYNDRPYKHFLETRENTTNRHRFNKIQKYLNEGYTNVDMIRYHTTNMCSDSAYDLEHQLIMAYGRCDIESYGILTNVHPGGEGGPVCSGQTYNDVYGATKADAIRKKISDANTGKIPHNKGVCGFKHSDESRRNMASAATERMLDEDYKANTVQRCIDNAKSRKGIVISDDEKRKKRIAFILNRREFYLSIIKLEEEGYTSISAIVRQLSCGRGKVETFFRQRDDIMNIISA